MSRDWKDFQQPHWLPMTSSEGFFRPLHAKRQNAASAARAEIQRNDRNHLQLWTTPAQTAQRFSVREQLLPFWRFHLQLAANSWCNCHAWFLLWRKLSKQIRHLFTSPSLSLALQVSEWRKQQRIDTREGVTIASRKAHRRTCQLRTSCHEPLKIKYHKRS